MNSGVRLSPWEISNRRDSDVVPIADRHYNRQKIGSPQFAPPGRAFVLRLGNPVGAFWITSWPFAEYVRHAWAGAWVCSAFRNETPVKASYLIREAVACSRWFYGDAPPLGMVTFVDPRKVRGERRRGVTVYGACYLRAGFRDVGFTKGGLVALQMLPEDMPEPARPMGAKERWVAR